MANKYFFFFNSLTQSTYSIINAVGITQTEKENNCILFLLFRNKLNLEVFCKKRNYGSLSFLPLKKNIYIFQFDVLPYRTTPVDIVSWRFLMPCLRAFSASIKSCGLNIGHHFFTREISCGTKNFNSFVNKQKYRKNSKIR